MLTTKLTSNQGPNEPSIKVSFRLVGALNTGHINYVIYKQACR